MSETIDVAVVGAGMSGLGVAAALRARGVDDCVVLEQGTSAGHFWSTTYDRLHLHSAFHDMPHDDGMRAEYPIFLARDEVVDYLVRWAELHGVDEAIRTRTRVDSISLRDDDSACLDHPWRLETSAGELFARYVCVATAMNRLPFAPDFEGQDRFRGRIIHSAEYTNARLFADQRVLVVGSGNSATEIALDLVEGGAGSVSMWVRAPRHFIPVKRMARLFRVMRFLGAISPESQAREHLISVGDPEFDDMVKMRDRIVGLFSVDLSRYGIGRPTMGPFEETYHANRIPTFDQGAIAKIRKGEIRIVDGNTRPIRRFTETGAVLGDDEEPFDAVVLGTGYSPGLESFLHEPSALAPRLGWKHYPITDRRCRSTVFPSLFFPGFDRTPLGGFSLGRWGWEVGDRIADELVGPR